MLRQTWTQLKTAARALHQDEGGAEGMEKLLIVAAIVLPLLGFLILFRNTISEWVSGNWETVRNDADSGVPDTLPN